MDYLSEQEVVTAFYNLIGIQAEIYDLTMEKLLELEKSGINNPLEYDKIIKKINRLKVKENRIYEKLDTSEYYYGLLDVVQNMIKEISILDEKKYEAIDERLDYYFSNLFEEEIMTAQMNENIYDYVDIDEDYEGEIVIIPEFNTIDFYTPIQVRFLKELMNSDPKNEEYLKYKFYNSFICPRLEDELILARYNPDNICIIDDELGALAYEMDADEYKNNVNLAKESFAENAFTNFVQASIEENVTCEKLDLPYKEVLFGVSNLETKPMADFIRRHFDSNENYVVSYEAIDYFDRLGNSLLQNIFKRDDYNETILNILNSDNVDLDFAEVKFDKEIYDNLFNLINISKEIYFVFTDLYCLDLIGKKGKDEYIEKLDLLEDLMKKEKEYASNLYFDKEEKGAVCEIISKYLEFIYALDGRGAICDNNEVNNQIICKRIKGILWNELVPDMSTFKDESVPYTIIKNFQLECLGEYEKMISCEDKSDYLGFKYLEIISDANLSEEFIFERGYIENAIILGDEIVSKILDLELDEYLYDKDDLIANHAYDIMASLVKFPKDCELAGIDKAVLDYQTVALETAFKYVNEEELEVFKSNFASSSMIENSILGKRLKSIFSNKEKKLEFSKKRH